MWPRKRERGVSVRVPGWSPLKSLLSPTSLNWPLGIWGVHSQVVGGGRALANVVRPDNGLLWRAWPGSGAWTIMSCSQEVLAGCQHLLGTAVYTSISPSARQLQMGWDLFGKMKDWGAI